MDIPSASGQTVNYENAIFCTKRIKQLRSWLHPAASPHSKVLNGFLLSLVLGWIAMKNLLLWYLFIYLLTLTADGFLPGGSGTTIRHNTQITHHPQTKHITQYYTNNDGHTTRNEYNANSITTTTNTIATTINKK
jgi:hypothetical protein